ncbi:Os01g0310600 [Oryza sativa Japonica Group]|uniref:Os01g0310600 protein n=2 Tax=Oryza sativa subsp. japonica TaxID=39947 RepID=B7F318_ORYSJ|nr:unknown protein [Oryza sativa Japonica Group]BAG99015.1 unnamed protein product [Oryza sativa Japonica Group]BAH91029.1 Os01g0310600 [Oryza sativa Japonica Group]|eukprot:NP_001172299.1 Os01g0310600 [Oryza sativa Japonica Group]
MGRGRRRATAATTTAATTMTPMRRGRRLCEGGDGRRRAAGWRGRPAAAPVCGFLLFVECVFAGG